MAVALTVLNVLLPVIVLALIVVAVWRRVYRGQRASLMPDWLAHFYGARPPEAPARPDGWKPPRRDR